MDSNNEVKETSIINQISMTKISGDDIRLKGDKKVLLLPSEVSKYKDVGLISSNGELKENKNYVSHSNLKKQVGDYNYLYIIKRNGLLNTINRNIYVVSEKYTDYFKIYGHSIYKLEKDTDKYRFYCSVTDSYMTKNEFCSSSCSGRSSNGINHVIVESTETSFVKYYFILPRPCEAV